MYYSKLTSGAFDLTVGPLVKLWDIGFPDARIPAQSEIDATLPLIDFNLVTLDKNSHSIYLEKKGMLLDLGGIGKGYAADEVANILRESGVEHAIIDLGGNVYALVTNLAINYGLLGFKIHLVFVVMGLVQSM